VNLEGKQALSIGVEVDSFVADINDFDIDEVIFEEKSFS